MAFFQLPLKSTLLQGQRETFKWNWSHSLSYSCNEFIVEVLCFVSFLILITWRQSIFAKLSFGG